MSGIPASAVKLTIPADSLRKLPDGAVYRGKGGQANLTVGNDGNGNIVAEASCDSLQQMVLWYEEELVRIRSDTATHESADTRMEERHPPLPAWIFLSGMAGLAAGVILTLKIKKRNGK